MAAVLFCLLVFSFVGGGKEPELFWECETVLWGKLEKRTNTCCYLFILCLRTVVFLHFFTFALFNLWQNFPSLKVFQSFFNCIHRMTILLSLFILKNWKWKRILRLTRKIIWNKFLSENCMKIKSKKKLKIFTTNRAFFQFSLSFFLHAINRLLTVAYLIMQNISIKSVNVEENISITFPQHIESYWVNVNYSN